MKYFIIDYDDNDNQILAADQTCYLDGYHIAERKLEGMPIKLEVDHTGTLHISIDDNDVPEYMDKSKIAKDVIQYIHDDEYYVDSVTTEDNVDLLLIREDSPILDDEQRTLIQ